MAVRREASAHIELVVNHIMGIGASDVPGSDPAPIRMKEGPRRVGGPPSSLPRRGGFAQAPQRTAQRQRVVGARRRQCVAVIRDERDWPSGTGASRESLAPDPKVVSHMGDIGDDVPGQVGNRLVSARISERHDGLMGVHKRKWRRRRPDIAPAPDRLNRDFTAARPNQRWVADISEFPTGEGKLHVAGVRDLCHRGLVGWSMGSSPDAELVVDAVVMALGRAEPDPDGLVHHSDKGGAYVSGDFCSMADLAGLQVSFGSTGDCYDNAAMETFWSTLKREITWIRGSIYFPTRHEARLYLFEFIEVFYNRQRHQAGLGHRTPVEFAATFNP